MLGFAVRMIVVLCVFRNVAAPSLDHNLFGAEMGWTARSIAAGQGFSSPFLPLTGPTALVPPVFPYLLAGIFRLCGLYTSTSAFAILSLNSLLSALTCVPVYLFSRNALDSRIARLASLGWTLYPFGIYFSAARVWDYALTSLLFCCCLLAAQKLHVRSAWVWAGFGVLYGFTTLSNPSIVTMLPVLLGVAIFRLWRAGKPWFWRGLMAFLMVLAVCTPWSLRNARVLHSHAFIRDGFWLEFYAGNTGDTFNSNDGSAHPASNPAEMRKYEASGEIAYMAEKRDLALAFVSRHPLVFTGSCVRRVVRFWTGYWSFSRRYLAGDPLDVPDVPFCIFLTCFMLRGARRWWRHDREVALPYLLAMIIFPVPYYLTHSSPDYRQPIEPLILLLVTVGLFGLQARTSKASSTLTSLRSRVAA